VNTDVFIVGSDRSSALARIAACHQPHEVLVADALALPLGGGGSNGHGNGRFDFALSIAVIHHLSTPTRRIEAIAEILRCLKQGGQALIYVWALEQKNSRRGWDEGHEQDVMVPWVMKTGKGKGKGKQTLEDGLERDAEGKETEATFQRYYHLYREGELEGDVAAAGGVVVRSGYERDNWWAVVGTGSGND